MATGFWQRWLRRLGKGVRSSSQRRPEQRSKRTRLFVETLEDRLAPADFTSGNIAVVQLATNNSTTNTTGSIVELSPTTASQNPVQTIAIANSLTGTGNIRMSDSGTSSFLSNSNDGTELIFTGYNTTDTTDSDLANSPTNDRAVVTMDNTGTDTIQTTYTGISGNQIRSATSLDDATFYITDKGGLYTNGATSPSLSTNILDARSFGGTVYVSSTKAGAGVSTLSSPAATTLNGLPGIPADGSIQDFYLIQSGSNGSTYDILYTIDQNTTKTSPATINKYSLVSGTWVSNGSFSVSGNATGMIAENNGSGGASLFVVTTAQAADNSVVRLTDSAGYNATINVNTANNVTLYTASGSNTLKDIAFVPIPATDPTITTPVKSGVGISTATLGGTITTTGGEPITQRGVVLSSTNSNPMINGSGVSTVVASGTSLGSFGVGLTGLQSNTIYYFAAFATNSVGTAYTTVGTFTTTNANPPTIDTPSATSITSTGASLGGTVESDDGATISKTGVVYALASQTHNPQIGSTGVIEVDTTSPVDSGAFTINATGLIPGDTYYFEAFATNSSGTTYTAASSFTTLAPPTVNAPTIADVTSSSAELGGTIASNGGSAITSWGVVYALTYVNAKPQLGGTGVTEVDATGTPSGAFTVPVSGLSGATEYTFEVFATNAIGTTYTKATNFTTAAPGIITAWTFPTIAGAPDNSPAPTYGTGTATTLGMTNNLTNGNGTGNTASDDVISTSGTADPNFTENLWRIRGTPNNGWALSAPQYSQGIELDTSTVGYSNIVFSFDWYSTTQGIRDLQVQYNTGSGWVNYQGPSPTGTFVATSNDYNNAGLSPVNPTIYIDLSNVAGASNNPDLGIRLVSAYDSTDTLGNLYASAASTPGAIVPYNNTSGNWRFGNLTFYGNLTTTTTTLSASPSGSQDNGQNVTFTATVTPSSGSQSPTGTVNFYDGDTLLGSQSVIQVGTSNVGTATLTLNSLTPGIHDDITAQYVPAVNSGMIASGSSMNLTVGANPISYVINAPQATGVDVSPIVGQPFTGVVATFSDGLDTNPNDFRATINWGDGNVSSGTIAFVGTVDVTNISGAIVPVSLFTVTGTNTYAAAGSDTISVTITDAGNNSATVNPTARAAYAPLAVTEAPAINAVAGVAFTNVTVATFTDPGLVANLAADDISDPTTQFTANISWGDGSAADTGTITYNATTQTFDVVGSHIYSQTGPFSISVTVTPLTLSVEQTDSSDPNRLNEVGDEDNNGLTDSPSPDFIDQYVIGAANQTGSLYTFSLPTVATNGGNLALTNSSYSRSEGELSLSTNGAYLVTGGYNSTVTLWGPQSTYSPASVVNRVIAVIDGAGNINTTTDLTDTYSGDNFRGVVSTDGTQFWTAGHSGDASDYVHYAQLGATTSTIVTGPNDPNNINTVELFNGQLYEGVRKVASDAPAGIYQIGTGLPTTAGQAQTLFIEVPQRNPLDVTDSDNPTSPNGFYMTYLNDGNPTINGVNVAYVADSEMGIARYDYTTSGWQFSYYIDSTGSFLDSAYTVDGNGNITATSSFNPADPAASSDPSKAGGVRELTGRVVNGQVQLFAVTGFGTGSEPNPGESLIEVTDTGAVSGYTKLATDTGASVFTGVAFTPYQAVTSKAVVDAITQNPASLIIIAGQNAQFSAATANPSGTDTVRWQISTDGGKTFTPLSDSGVFSGTGTDTLTVTNAPISLNNAEFEAVFTAGTTTLTTSPATLTVVGPGATLVGTTLYLVGGANTNDNVHIGSSGSNVTVSGTLDGAQISGTYAATAIYFVGYNGNEIVKVDSSVVIPVSITAGNGNDNMQLGNGNYTVTLGNGNDNVTAGNGSSTITVGAGNDVIQLGTGGFNTVIVNGNGNDNIQIGSSNYNSVMVTGNGNDNVTVGAGSYDTVTVVGNGNDNLQLGSGTYNTYMLLGDGHDKVKLGTGWTDG